MKSVIARLLSEWMPERGACFFVVVAKTDTRKVDREEEHGEWV
jgi:hypothetical protein